MVYRRPFSDMRARAKIRDALAALDEQLPSYPDWHPRAGDSMTFEGAARFGDRPEDWQAGVDAVQAAEAADRQAGGPVRLRAPQWLPSPASRRRVGGKQRQLRQAAGAAIREQLELDDLLAAELGRHEWAPRLAAYLVRLARSAPDLPRETTIEAGSIALLNLAAGRELHDTTPVVRRRLLARGFPRATVDRVIDQRGPDGAERWLDAKSERQAMIEERRRQGASLAAATRAVDRRRRSAGAAAADALRSRPAHR